MGTFTPMTSKPSKSDKYIYLYNNSKNGGKSLCIAGKPADSTCNVLCNCVGWACGRFNHIYNLITGYNGMKYSRFCCNAENFIEVAKSYGLSVGTTPKPGAIMCWQKGATIRGSDGAGHVAIVEKVISSTKVMTSESGYGNFVFKNKTRSKGSGNWGAGSSYKFRGFIYNPAVTSSSSSGSTNTSSSSSTAKVSAVARNASVNQIYVGANNLRVRSTPRTSGTVVGYVSKGYHNYYEVKSANGYTWYRIGTNRWIAHNVSWSKVYPVSTDFKVGDTVKLTSNATIYGKSTRFSSWVYNATLYVREIDGDKITVSIVKVGPTTGVVSKKHLIKK